MLSCNTGRLRHPKEQVLADFKNVVAAVKKNYPFVKKIGQEGFCWVRIKWGAFGGAMLKLAWGILCAAWAGLVGSAGCVREG